MKEGDVVGGRFVVRGFAAAGGMARVYRAHDRETDAEVALKVASVDDDEFRDRFLREARILATLNHPNVVRYVESGLDGGVPFLAMQWLDGETLAARLRRGALDESDTVAVLSAISAGVGHAHARGLVHRDLKPSNVLLAGGHLESAIVLDFGLARQVSGRSALTQTGILVGTLGYMAPEQLRAPDGADARSDVFALGCVLYQCLTGRQAYPERDVPVVIGRILFDPSPSALDVAPHTSRALARLATQAMSKDPSERPRDASEFLRMLVSGSIPPSRSSSSDVGSGITARERRRGSLILVTAIAKSTAAEGSTVTVPLPSVAIDAILAPFAGRAIALGEDLTVVLVPPRGAAVDHATEAVRCALRITEAIRGTRCAVVTGQSEAEDAPVLGELFARAVELDGAAASATGVLVDLLTGDLVRERFEQEAVTGGRRVRGERMIEEPSRRLLGRSTPFVGRERELAALEGLIAESIAEASPRLALVCAEPGIGKSRLRAELAARVAASPHEVRVVTASGDSRASSSPFGLARALLRAVLDLVPGEDVEIARARILARLPEAKHASAPFVGELAGVPFDENRYPKLRAVRRSQGDLVDQLRGAFLDVILSESKRRPLLLIVEDVHWADPPSLAFLDAIPRTEECALALVAFGRSTFRADHPRHLASPDLALTLGPLSTKAATRLVRAALPGLGEADTAELVSQSVGNAFFLEELVRSHAAGGRRPDTVITSLQARLEALDPDRRRFLRAASVVGEVFWLEAVAGVTGSPLSDVFTLARVLESDEFIVAERASRYAETTELRFVHGLVRDAAYAMLPDADRSLAHRLTASWLHGIGEPDARVVAEHWDAGGQLNESRRGFVRAAEQALAANEIAVAAELARRAAGPTDDMADAALVEAEAVVSHDAAAALARAEHAANLFGVGVPQWYRSKVLATSARMRLGDVAGARATGEQMLAAPLSEDGIDERINLVHAAHALSPTQDRSLVRRLVEKSAVRPGLASDPVLDGLREISTSLGQVAAPNLGSHLREFRRMAEMFEGIGQARRSLPALLNLGFSLNVAGAFAEGSRILDGVVERALALGLEHLARAAAVNRATSLVGLGDYEGALTLASSAFEYFERHRDPRFTGSSLTCRARASNGLGRHLDARQNAEAAVEGLASFPASRALALGALAEAALALEDVEEALRAAAEGVVILDAVVGVHDDALLRLTYIRALRTHRDDEGALDVGERMLARLEERHDGLEGEVQHAFWAAPLHRALADEVTALRSKLGRSAPSVQ